MPVAAAMSEFSRAEFKDCCQMIAPSALRYLATKKSLAPLKVQV